MFTSDVVTKSHRLNTLLNTKIEIRGQKSEGFSKSSKLF